MRFGQQRCALRRMIAVDLRIGYALHTQQFRSGSISLIRRLVTMASALRELMDLKASIQQTNLARCASKLMKPRRK